MQNSLAEPLLPDVGAGGSGDVAGCSSSQQWRVAVLVEEPLPRYQRSSLWATTVNMTNAVLGAGMLALPHAFAGLGVLGGVATIALVGVITYSSVAVLLRPTERTGKLTYAAVVGAECGPGAALAVRVSIIVGSAGFLVLYLIVLADLLIGSEDYSGIIPDLWPSLPDPLPWCLRRTAVLTWVTLLVAPFLSPRTLGGVAPISALKVFCSVLCVSSLVALWAILLLQGRLPPVQWLPDPRFFGRGTLTRLANMLTIIPVCMTALLCHMSIHPLVQDLADYTPRRMRIAVASCMFICASIYATIGAAGLVVYGQDVKGDVLANLSIDAVTDILHGNEPLAMAFVGTVKVAMAISMVLSFPITLWPMRQDILDVMEHLAAASPRGASPRAALPLIPSSAAVALADAPTPPSALAHYTVTYLSLALIYLVALCVKSAYQMVGIVGSITGCSMAFVFPGLLGIQDPVGGAHHVFGWALAVSGVLLAVIGLTCSEGSA